MIFQFITVSLKWWMKPKWCLKNYQTWWFKNEFYIWVHIYTRNYLWLGQHQPNTSVRMVIGCVSTNSYLKLGRKNWQSENCACFISNFFRNIYLQYCTDIILLVTNNIITEKMNWQKQWNSGSDLYLLPIYFIIYNYEAKIPYCAIIIVIFHIMPKSKTEPERFKLNYVTRIHQ